MVNQDHGLIEQVEETTELTAFLTSCLPSVLQLEENMVPYTLKAY